MRLYNLLLFLLLLQLNYQLAESLAPTPHIDWCLYWRYLNKDQYRPECNGIYRLRFAKHKVYDQHRPSPSISNLNLNLPNVIPTNSFSRFSTNASPSQLSWSLATNSPRTNFGYSNQNLKPITISFSGNDLSFGTCSSTHSNCRISSSCPSGQLCVDSNGYCCGQPRVVTNCPSPESLASNCSSRRKQINWCSTHSECAPHLASRQNALYSDSYLLDSLNRYPSLCCPTQCGYNICVR